MSGLEAILVHAVEAAGAELAGHVDERELELALQAQLEKEARGAQVRRQASVQLADQWFGRIGPVDLVVEGEKRALIELKWDPRTLAACAWDCLKLACLLSAEPDSRAFLVAGTREAIWQRDSAKRLFDGEWPLADLLHQYAGWFAFWREDVANYPLLAPAAWRCRAVTQPVPLTVEGQPWQIRVAEVELTEGRLEQIVYAPVLRSQLGLRGTTPAIEPGELPDPDAEDRMLRDHNPPGGEVPYEPPSPRT